MIQGPPLTGEDTMQWAGDYARIGAEICPDRPAILAPELGDRWTYAELDRRVCRAVYLLREMGVKPGDRVAYIGRNDPHYFVFMMAAMRGGFILTPLNWRCQTPEIEFFLSDSGAGICFSDDDFVEIVEQAGRQAQMPLRILSIRPDATKADTSFARALAEDGPVETACVPRGPTPCLLMYTSGTSGRPKGTLCTHKAFTIMRHAEFIFSEFPQWKDETVISAMPTFHIAGMTWVMVGLIRQCQVVLTPDPSPANLIKLFREYGATRTFAVPTVIRDIVDEIRRSGVPVPTLKMFFYGAMPIGETLLRDAIDTLGCSFGQFYGMTEIGGSATFLSEWNHSLEKPELMLSKGLPFPGVDIDIRDTEGNSLPAGEAGEIYLRTPTIMPGYWNRPDADATAMVGEWYRTGDGGYLDDQGFLYLTDRIKDMIVTGGENVYPAEVEEILIRHPAIAATAVVARPDRRWGEAVAAIVQFHPGKSATAEEIIAFAKASLAGYKCPKSVHVVEALPRTASGKIQRAQAKADYHAWLAERGEL